MEPKENRPRTGNKAQDKADEAPEDVADEFYDTLAEEEEKENQKDVEADLCARCETRACRQDPPSKYCSACIRSLIAFAARKQLKDKKSRSKAEAEAELSRKRMARHISKKTAAPKRDREAFDESDSSPSPKRQNSPPPEPAKAPADVPDKVPDSSDKAPVVSQPVGKVAEVANQPKPSSPVPTPLGKEEEPNPSGNPSEEVDEISKLINEVVNVDDS